MEQANPPLSNHVLRNWQTFSRIVGLAWGRWRNWDVLPGRIQEHPFMPKLCTAVIILHQATLSRVKVCLSPLLMSVLWPAWNFEDLHCRQLFCLTLLATWDWVCWLFLYSLPSCCAGYPMTTQFFGDVSLPALRPLAELDHRNSFIADMMTWELPAWINTSTTVSDIPGIDQAWSHSLLCCTCTDKFDFFMPAGFLSVRFFFYLRSW